MNPRILSIILVILFVISYGIYGARFILWGPQIQIVYPENHSSVMRAPTVEVKTVRAAELYINGKAVSTDIEGNGHATILLRERMDTITATVKDKFGHEKSETITVQVQD